MAKGVFIRNGNVLVPCDERDRELLARFKTGQKLLIELKAPRNLERLRLFFALLHLVVTNSHFTNEEALLDTLKSALGLVSPYLDIDGTLKWKPRSIAFERMEEDAFSAFFDNCVVLICSQILPGLRRQDLVDELNQMLAGAPRHTKPDRS